MHDLMTFVAAHMALTYTLAILLLLIMIVEFIRLKRSHFYINVSKAIQLINRENAVVIDIRPKEMFQKGHIIDSISLSIKEIHDHPKKIEKFRTKPILLVGNTGNELQKVAALLLKQGYNVYSITGGVRAWVEAQLPLVKE